ncbi:TetR/AcrR family transcriptional regulator [Streptosporangium sp. KLBMP 9127]|nr:TetR/AcrR family transcriptional regulator [Streptosporangium sp. KLBMP 9127]
MTSPAPVSRRARPAKAPLSRDVIVRAGLRILDRDGMDALTMRRVGTELDTGAASLYVYVRNRDELLTLMCDEALGEVPLPADRGGSWRTRLTNLVNAYIEALARHRGLALVALGTIPAGPNALLITERMLALLKEGGLTDDTAAWAVDLLGLHLTAVAAEQSAHHDQTVDGGSEAAYLQEVGDHFAALPPDRFPMITALREPLLAGSGEQRATWFLHVLLTGILATPVER